MTQGLLSDLRLGETIQAWRVCDETLFEILGSQLSEAQLASGVVGRLGSQLIRSLLLGRPHPLSRAAVVEAQRMLARTEMLQAAHPGV